VDVGQECGRLRGSVVLLYGSDLIAESNAADGVDVVEDWIKLSVVIKLFSHILLNQADQTTEEGVLFAFPQQMLPQPVAVVGSDRQGVEF
jgi:hypothetical protein